MIAGAAPPVAVLEGAESIGIKLTHVYGLTEVYGPASVCAEQPGWDDLPADQRAQLKRRQGVPYPLQEDVTVIDPETMQPVPRDGETIGEVMFRGNIVMKGYLKNEKATREAFAGGWFHTGDLGVVDEHGYVIIKDRSKDIIISGGENISSVEVEDVLYKHPAVLFAAVVAKPDSKWGEVPCAFVELKDNARATEAEIIAFCRGQMSGFKTPKAVVFGPIPKTSTGKIQKFMLRDQVQFGEGDFGLSAGHASARLLQRQPHAVIGRDNVRRQALPQHLVVEIGMHVGDDGAARLEAIDPGQRVVDAEMAGMPGIAQPVDDPEFEMFQKRPARGRDVADIGRVGGLADPIAERRNIAVLQEERRKRHRTALPFDGAAFAGLDRHDGPGSADSRCLAARRSNRKTAAGCRSAVDWFR